MTLQLLKDSHILFVACSYLLFCLRGIWSLNGAAVMRQRWVGIVPHVVDTLLIVTALALAYGLRQYPFVDAWLTAKVIGLLVYIALGFVALRQSVRKHIRVVFWLAAQAVFAYIVLVAVTRNPVPW